MDYSINHLDKQYLFNVPLAFVLQKHEIKVVEQVFDDNGWNIFHHAVGECDIPKIIELLHFSFDISLNTQKNIIPSDIYSVNEKRKFDKLKVFNKIPFCKNGFTGIHLAMFLFDYYNKLSDDFFYQSVTDKYRTIILKLINERSDWGTYVDSDGHTPFDYAFLLENIHLIDLLHSFDSSFSTLKEVNSNTAKKIVEVMSIKYKDGTHDHIINFLQKKAHSETLEKELNSKKEAAEKKSIKKI